MKIQSTDLISLLSAVAALAGSTLLTTFGDSVEAIAPGWGKKTVGILTAIAGFCAIVVYVLKNRSTPDGLHKVLSPDPAPTAASVLTTHADPEVDQIAATAKAAEVKP